MGKGGKTFDRHIMQTWDHLALNPEILSCHKVKLSSIPATATRAAHGDLNEWRRKYGTTSDHLAVMKSVELQEELMCLKGEWPTFKDSHGEAIPAPSLPADLQKHSDSTKKSEGHWARPLLQWTETQMGKDKPRLMAMLGAARTALVAGGVLKVPARPTETSMASAAAAPAILGAKLSSQPLLRAVPRSGKRGRETNDLSGS